jgi:hypothetical protein
MKAIIPIALLLQVPSHADVLNPVQRFFGIGGQFPGETPPVASPHDLAPFSPADSDLGVQEILTPYDGRSPVAVNFSTGIFRTDNAPTGISSVGESSWVWSNTLTAAWRPRIVAGWFGDFGLGQEILRYDRSSALDYENFLLRLGTLKTIPQLDDLVVFARFEYQRLTTGSFSDGDYNAQRVRMGIDKALWTTPRHLLSAGISTAFDLTATPDLLERNDYTAEISHRYAITDTLFTLASVQYSFFDYDAAGREDDYVGVAVQLIWQVQTDAHFHLSVFYDNNDSNAPAGENDYEAFTGGFGAGFTFRF